MFIEGEKRFIFNLLSVYLIQSPSPQGGDNLVERSCQYNKKLKFHYMHYISKCKGKIVRKIAVYCKKQELKKSRDNCGLNGQRHFHMGGKGKIG